MRTTVDLDAPVLRELKRLQKVERKSLGRLISDLVGHALALRKTQPSNRAPFQWISRPMGARVDIRDKDALHALLDGERSHERAASRK